MSIVTEKNEERGEVMRYATPSVKNAQLGLSFIHHNISHYIVRFQRSRAGIINHLVRIKKEEQELLQLKERKKEIRAEFINIRQFIRAANKRNRILEGLIKEEKNRLHLLDTNIAILKAHKNRILKMQEITKKEFNYMTSAIENVKERNDKDLTKYYDVMIDKKKLKNENKKMKEETHGLQNILKHGKRNHEKIKKDLNDLVTV